MVATERGGIELGRRYGDHSTSHAIEAMPRLVIGLFTLEKVRLWGGFVFATQIVMYSLASSLSEL